MKRLFLILCSALALAACNKIVENSLSGEGNSAGHIVFRAEQLTKSVTESTASVLHANGFRVAAVTGTTTFFNENVSYVSENAWFETAQTYYYPSVATNFFAVYPKTQAISIDGTGAATLTYTSDGSTDLIAAKALDVVSRETPQPLTFDHILSQVVIKCQGSDANATYVVKSVTLSNSDAATYAYSTGAWTGANKAKASTIVSSNTAASTSAFTTMGEAVTAVPAEMDLRVTWDCLQGSTVVGSYDETVSFTPTMGKVCTVNCTLPNKDAQVIKFTISVNPWGEETQNVVFRGPVTLNVNKTFVNSLANVSTKSLNNTDLDIDELIDGLINGTSVDVVLNDGDFAVSTDIEDLDNPETDGGKIYLTSNSEETKGYSYDISYSEEEWKISSTGYLIFEAISDGTIIWKATREEAVRSLYYRKNNDETWYEWTSSIEGTPINVVSGDVVYLKGILDTPNNISSYNTFSTGTANYYVYGNVNSIINNAELTAYVFYSLFKDNTSIRNHPSKEIILPAATVAEQCYSSMFNGCTGLTSIPVITYAKILAPYCYESMFCGCTGLVSAPICLPATTLADYCYHFMFYGCTSLTSAPELPATSLAPGCYYAMFEGCTNLTSAPELPATILASSCYARMFVGCSSLTSAPELPATTLANNCYTEMFRHCSGLTSAPELPATTLTNYCYKYMFEDCSSLTSAPELPSTSLTTECYAFMFRKCVNLMIAPELPATVLSESCYQSMFNGCSSLITAPDLPATTLASYCYSNMFYGCSSLTTAPELPATTLFRSCYNSMFMYCTSLTSAPELPAETLVNSCYKYMFKECPNLNYVKAMFKTLSSGYIDGWLFNVSSTGTFVKNSAATWNVTGASGIPSGWTVQTASE